MGKTGGTCGAVTAALMVIGLKCGTTDSKDKDTNERCHDLGRKLMQEFTSRNRTTVCSELLGFDVYTRERLTADESRVIFDNCRKYIQDASEIIEEIMKT